MTTQSNVVRMDGTHVETTAEAPSCIVFRNRGEIDMRAVRTMGISAKEPGAIGFFGTGLKYAVAVLMREAQELIIWSGTTKYTFAKQQIDFRGKAFELLTMNGEELPFTTELGKTWAMWQAFRELYCNCTDEHGEITKAPEIEGEAGYTTIIAKGEAIVDAFDDRAATILQTARWTGDDNVAVHKGRSNSIFYRGVKVQTINPAMHTYNILGDLELTEDRTTKYWWVPRGRIMNTILQSNHREFVEACLTAPQGTYEHELNFLDGSEATAVPSETFLSVCDALNPRAETEGFNLSAGQLALNYRRQSLGQTFLPVATLSEVKKQQLARAEAFCEKMGFPVTYPVVVTDSLGQNTIGMAENGVIYLNMRAFTLGTKVLVATLIEEQVHLQYGLKDETRAMQNFLFERLVDQAAEHHGEVL